MNKIIIKKIVNLMKNHDIKIDEIVKAINEQQTVQSNKNRQHPFDLLVEEDGVKRRLPFELGRDKKVLGIFPWSVANIYLEVFETEHTTRLGVNEEDIPPVSFWKSIFKIVDVLNETLTSIGAPVIDGSYFAGTPYPYKECFNYIVQFKKDAEDLLTDFYTDSTVAKIRHFGTHSEK